MTKFEEEFKALTSWYWVNVDLIQQILTRFGNWHSDEEFQELISKYSGLNDNYEKEVIRSSKLESQIIDLKSQLQPQALPVVPECVAKLFNEYRFENIQRLFEFGIDDIKSNKMIKALMWRDKHPDTFSLAFITGKYEVEKPQLFYLKNKLTRLYLFKAFGYSKYGEQYELRKEKDFQFTQKEIDSMQTGSYEQIKAEKEK
ncbi:DUF1642 domain-containing protein [Lactococcus lactis]|uniref:DUF1642 domain-containing protein n=1 Tax=Lactococcus lactis TaxID=1358 RepID=UPI0022E47A33|nr:DUF1642 domain-containing protein [Lactococcus lactis]